MAKSLMPIKNLFFRFGKNRNVPRESAANRILDEFVAHWELTADSSLTHYTSAPLGRIPSIFIT